MERELKAILLTRLKHCPDFEEYYPNNGNQIHKDNLITLSKLIKKYGNGYLQSKSDIYYYRTFTYDNSEQMLFCIIYYKLPYNRAYVENLVEDIYELTYNQIIFIHNEFNSNISSEINKLFFKYASMHINERLSNDINNRNSSIYSSNNNISNYSLRKQRYSRIIEQSDKGNNDLGKIFSVGLDEVQLNYALNQKKIFSEFKINKWKKSKKRWLLFFIIITVLLYGLLGFYIYFNFDSIIKVFFKDED